MAGNFRRARYLSAPFRRLSHRDRIRRRPDGPRRLSGESLEPRTMLAAAAVITEFMASNSATLADEDGDYPDWIELYNPGLESIDLEGFYLTDDPDNLTRWQIPQTSIAAGQYLVVFASGKDRTPAAGNLHTSFKLNAGGEFLALVGPDGQTVESAFSPEYPRQTADVSFGTGTDLVSQGFFVNPTPGTANIGEPIDDPTQAVAITEIMYHPPTNDVADEFIEILNIGVADVDLTGWQLTGGIALEFPEEILAAGERLVVAADRAAIQARHPEIARVLGDWSGKLSNRSEEIELRNPTGHLVDRVVYADEGNWAVRARGPDDRGHRGWQWQAEHDGGGRSLELITPILSNAYGQNWSSSLVEGGTPGANNSAERPDVAPLILDVSHAPVVPASTDPVRVRARLVDERFAGATAALFWRVDGAGQPFVGQTMHDDGQHGDGDARDGVFAAVIPPHPDGTVIEFYVRSTDDLDNQRTWPAPTQPSGLQEANLLYQVLDAHAASTPWEPGALPVYLQVMTAAERSEFRGINRSSNAQFNATFISIDGTGTDVRYNAGVRIRGSGSRDHNPPNNRINIPSDTPWNGVDQLNINAVGVNDQIAGSTLFRLAGLPAADAHAVMMYSNGENLNDTAPYAHLETLNSDFAANHFSGDNGGNLYKGRRPNESPPGGLGAGLAYFGPDPEPYVSYQKLTNEEAADWSDVINLTDVLNNSPEATFLQDVAQVVDVDQWLRFFALNALLDNTEGGLVNGDRQGDDYAMYRGVTDPRFRMIPHDLDSLFSNPRRPFFRMTNVPALDRLIRHPEILPRYYAQLTDLIHNVVSTDNTSATLDDALRHVSSQNFIDRIKQFLADRGEHILGEFPHTLTIDPGLPLVGEFFHTTQPWLNLSGTTPTVETRSVLVSGLPATELPGDGTWTFSSNVATGGDQIVLPAGSVWRYLDDGSNQQTAWREPDFDDSGWSSGPAPLGYGDNTEATVVGFVDTTPEDPGTVTKNATTYFRTTFQIDEPAMVTGLTVRMRYDDAAAVYINGVEAVRTPNLPAGAAHDTYSIIDTPDEGAFFDFTATPEAVAALSGGANVIAVEMHQGDAFSSDIKLDMELIAEMAGDVSSGIALVPGINRIAVEAFDGPHGTGQRLQREFVDVWYEGEPVSKTVERPLPDVAELRLSVRDTYVPGIPVMVRVEALDGQGRVQRDLWDAVVTLTTDRPGIMGSPTEFRLINGLGSQLVTFSGTGDVTVTAHIGPHTASRTLSSLETATASDIAGPLTGTSTTWSGIVRVTDDVSVPEGHTLHIEPGALILLDADPVGATDSTTIHVEGTLDAPGTSDRPITFTSADPKNLWGQLDVHGGTVDLAFVAIHRAGNAPRMGHTNTGAAVRLRNNANFSLVDGSISDLRGKILQSESGGVALHRTVLARAVMGPEIDNTALDLSDTWITDMRGTYHPGGTVDDNDGIYLTSQQAGQDIDLRDAVVAYTDDDGIDTLRSDVLVERSIVRGIGDKAISVFDGEVTVSRSLLINADIGINTKGQGTSTPRTIVDHVTIANVNRGIVAQDKDDPDPNVEITYDVANSIIWTRPGGDAVSTDYDPADIHIDYSNVGEPWPGQGNLNQDPLLFNPSRGDFRLQPGSPSIDAADPQATPDADDTVADQGYVGGGLAGQFAATELAGTLSSNTILTPYGGPYRVRDDVVVSPDATLVVLPGTSVYFDQGTELLVRGVLHAHGSEHRRLRFTSDPAAPPVPDLPGLPDGPPRWRGIHLENTPSPDNILAFADIEYAQDNENNHGSVGAFHSTLVMDGLTWRGTHRRMLLADDSSIVVRNSIFPDMFAPGENPAALGLNTSSEHITGVGGIPAGGQFVIQNNVFGSNKGHNDVIDVNSGQRPGPVLQVLDNVFAGSGDELIDLGGDAYIAGNFFAHVSKDPLSTDRGYASAISTGDTAAETTVVVSRNLFWDVDHAINLKRGAATIFENNTVVGVHDDFVDQFGATNLGSVVNLFVDEPGAQPGAGAYLEGNILWDSPRVFGSPDTPGGTTSALSMNHNLIDPDLISQVIGERDQTVADLGTHNFTGDPRFVDPNLGNFDVSTGSSATGTGPGGRPIGAHISPGIFVWGEPPLSTEQRTATLQVGGPGIFAFRYRLDGGPWSDPIAVGDGFDPGGTVRTAQLTLEDLADGPHWVEVVGQDFAGNWQAVPTRSETWTVGPAVAGIRINEVLASNQDVFEHEGSSPDIVELHNPGSLPFDLSGLSITDDPDRPQRFVFPPGTVINPGAYLTLFADSGPSTSAMHLGFGLDADGEGVYLFGSQASGAALIDSVSFGHQVPDLSIGRVGRMSEWRLTKPTIGFANTPVPTADPSALKINEWYANGNVRVEDDFLELYNPDSLPVVLSGLSLTDRPDSRPGRFEIPPLSFVGPESFVRFIADDNPQRGAHHLNFRLAAPQEMVTIFDSSGEEIDRVLYFSQTADVSQGRAPDGSSERAFFPLPTPGAANAVPTSPETVASIDWTDIWLYDQSGQDLGTSWRQVDYDDSAWQSGAGLLGNDADVLPAPINTQLDLGLSTHYFRKHFTLDVDPQSVVAELSVIVDDGAIIYVNGSEVARVRLPPGEIPFNEPAETVVVAGIEGPFHVPSQLLRAGDNVIAVEVHQNSPGSADMAFGLSFTASAVDDSVAEMIRMLQSLRITEIMYHPLDNVGIEFLELQNVGDAPLDLTGVRLAEGVEFTFPSWELAPGEYAVLTDDVAAFEQFYGESPFLVGQYAGRLNNGGEPLLLALPEPFDVGILRFSYDNTWRPETDGNGYALEVSSPLQHFTHWDNASGWQAGEHRFGTPGDTVVVVPADMDLDGDTDFDDIDAFLLGLSFPDIYEASLGQPPTTHGDMNGDGTLDFDDIPGFVTALAPPRVHPAGDLNLDYDLDFDDIDALVLGLSNPQAYEGLYGVSPATTGDLDKDGDLDFGDVEPFVNMLRSTAQTENADPVSRDASREGQRARRGNDVRIFWERPLLDRVQAVEQVMTDVRDWNRPSDNAGATTRSKVV